MNIPISIPINSLGLYRAIVIFLVSLIIFLFSITLRLPSLKILSLLGVLSTLFFLFFFRDPLRHSMGRAGEIISPADGKIIGIEDIMEEEYLHQEAKKISIFMSLTDVHINRSPIRGITEYIRKTPGRFAIAFTEKASQSNEKISFGIRELKEDGTLGENRILLRLVSGFLARKIFLFKKVSETVGAGERIGMIYLGSRVEIFLPKGINLRINKGERVKAGETILGSYPISKELKE